MPFTGGGSASFPKSLQSSSIVLNVGTITTATLTATYTGEMIFAMSADGGIHWEEVTSGVEHTFTNSGNDLRYKVVGNPGAVLSYIEIPYTVT